MSYLNIVKLRQPVEGNLIIVQPYNDIPRITEIPITQLPKSIPLSGTFFYVFILVSENGYLTLTHKRFVLMDILQKNAYNGINLFPTHPIVVKKDPSNIHFLSENLYYQNKIDNQPSNNLILEYSSTHKHPIQKPLLLQETEKTLFFSRIYRLLLAENSNCANKCPTKFCRRIHSQFNLGPVSVDNSSIDNIINAKIKGYKCYTSLHNLLSASQQMNFSHILKTVSQPSLVSKYENNTPIIQSFMVLSIEAGGEIVAPIESKLHAYRQINLGNNIGHLLHFFSDYYIPKSLPEVNRNQWGPITDEYQHYPRHETEQIINTDLHYYLLLVTDAFGSFELSQPINTWLKRGQPIAEIGNIEKCILMFNRPMDFTSDIAYYSNQHLSTQVLQYDYLGQLD